MAIIGPHGKPGSSTAVFSSEAAMFWGGEDVEILRKDVEIAPTAADAGASPTTMLRKGLLLGKKTSDGLAYAWDPNGVDGSEQLLGVNGQELNTIDIFGSARGLFPHIVVKAPLQTRYMLIEGAALIGHADEYLARKYLHLLGCRMEDDIWGYLSGLVPRIAIKATNYTVLAADQGTIFHAITAAAVFTLPAIKAGLRFEFMRTDAFTLSVVSAEGDNMIVGNDASADSVTWSTAGNMIGARMTVEAMYVNTVLKWVPQVMPAPFSTGTFLTQTLAT